uniref:Uncharacterized protein n=1 Tax=Peronospora matthiolae TaxID=2874970 RepID=A0AAV1TRK9_9STRA
MLLEQNGGFRSLQARASGGLIVSTNLPSMNELLTPASRVLITVKRQAHPRQNLGGQFKGKFYLKGVEGYVAVVNGSSVCPAVEKVLARTPAERERKRARVKRQYFVNSILLFQAVGTCA